MSQQLVLMSSGERRLVVGVRHDDVYVAQTILDTRICQETVTFSGFEILQTHMTVKTWMVELPVKMNSVPARTPKQVAGIAIHLVTIPMDRGIEPLLVWGDERLRYEDRD